MILKCVCFLVLSLVLSSTSFAGEYGADRENFEATRGDRQSKDHFVLERTPLVLDQTIGNPCELRKMHPKKREQLQGNLTTVFQMVGKFKAQYVDLNSSCSLSNDQPHRDLISQLADIRFAKTIRQCTGNQCQCGLHKIVEKIHDCTGINTQLLQELLDAHPDEAPGRKDSGSSPVANTIVESCGVQRKASVVNRTAKKTLLEDLQVCSVVASMEQKKIQSEADLNEVAQSKNSLRTFLGLPISPVEVSLTEIKEITHDNSGKPRSPNLQANLFLNKKLPFSVYSKYSIKEKEFLFSAYEKDLERFVSKHFLSKKPDSALKNKILLLMHLFHTDQLPKVHFELQAPGSDGESYEVAMSRFLDWVLLNNNEKGRKKSSDSIEMDAHLKLAPEQIEARIKKYFQIYETQKAREAIEENSVISEQKAADSPAADEASENIHFRFMTIGQQLQLKTEPDYTAQAALNDAMKKNTPGAEEAKALLALDKQSLGASGLVVLPISQNPIGFKTYSVVIKAKRPKTPTERNAEFKKTGKWTNEQWVSGYIQLNVREEKLKLLQEKFKTGKYELYWDTSGSFDLFAVPLDPANSEMIALTGTDSTNDIHGVVSKKVAELKKDPVVIKASAPHAWIDLSGDFDKK